MKKIIAAAALTAVMMTGVYALEKPTLVVNSGHVSSVCSAVFSPDGSKLVTVGSSRNDAVRIWDIESGRELHSISCNNTSDNELSYSPDGSTILCYSPKADLSLIIDAETGKEIANRYGVSSPDGKLIAQCISRDGTIRVLDVRSGKNIIQFKGHTAHINALSFSPDGRYLASGSSVDNRVRLWDVRSGKKIHDLEYTTYVEAVFFTPDGSRIIAAGGRFAMWDAKNGKKIREGGPNNVTARSISADGCLLAAADKDEMIVLDLESGSTFFSKKNEGSKISFVSFSPDGTRLVSTGKDSVINLWDISSGKLLHTLKEKDGFFPFAAFSPDGKTLVSYLNSALHLWDVETGNLRRSIKSISAQGKMIALTPDGKSIVSAERHGRICVITPNGNKTVRPLTDKAGQLNAIALSPDGRKLVTGASRIDRNLNVWDISRSNAKPLFSYPRSNADSVGFSADGKTFIVAGYNEIQKFDAQTGESIGYIYKKNESDCIRTAAITPDGKRLIYSNLFSMNICDISDGGNDRALPSSAYDPYELAISPDGATVLGTEKYGIRVTDIATGKNRLLLTHSENCYVRSVAFDRECKRIVSTDSHGTIRIWDASTGKQLHMLKGHTGNVINAQFTPDGSRVISSGSDTTIRIWDAAEGRLIATLYNFYGSEFAVVTPEGTYDGTPEALELMHWTIGNEVLPLSNFGETFRVNDLLAFALYGPLLKTDTAAGQNASSSAKPDIAKRLIGKIHSVNSDEVVVSYSGSGYLPKIGERFFVMNNEGEPLYLECAFPMISVSKCRITKASDRNKIKKGMPVFK